MAREIVTKVTNAILYDDGCIKIENVRLSYPHLDKSWKKEGTLGEPKFSLRGLLDKSTHKAAKDLVKKVIEEQIKVSKLPIGKNMWFLRDGDDSGKVEEAGMLTISSSEARRPSCRNRKGEVVDQDKVLDMFYGGAYGHMLIRPWIQNNEHGKRINASLIAVQFIKDGEPFGEGRIDDEGVFGSEGDDESGFEEDDDGL